MKMTLTEFKLKAFEIYLIAEHHRESTIQSDVKNVEGFLKWFEPKNMDEVVQLTTPILVEYINSLQQKQLVAATINIRLRSIRKYFVFLELESYPVGLKADNLKVKGEVKKVVVDPLNFSELEQLYKSYCSYIENKPLHTFETKVNQQKIRKRKTLLLSLLIHQGMHLGELKKLEVNHFNFDEGKVYIPSTSKGQSRHLKLHPAQVISFYTFINDLPSDQDFVFIRQLDYQLHIIIQELKGLNEKIQNARHIRASVIMHWLKLHGKRQTQYMIGHKWISSTEYYERQDLEALTTALDKFHPLRGSY